MSAPKIETFEYDIVDELKNKHADWVDVAKVDETKEINKEVSKISTEKIILIILSIILFIALSVLLILNYTKPKQATPLTQINPNYLPKSNQITFDNILPETSYGIGRFTSSVSMVGNGGYSIKILDYSSVYSYILKNETSFGKELQNLFGIEASTSTPAFKDVTLSNQDMRVLSTDVGTVVYAFIEDEWLVLSTSTEGILTTRNVILSR